MRWIWRYAPCLNIRKNSNQRSSRVLRYIFFVTSLYIGHFLSIIFIVSFFVYANNVVQVTIFVQVFLETLDLKEMGVRFVQFLVNKYIEILVCFLLILLKKRHILILTNLKTWISLQSTYKYQFKGFTVLSTLSLKRTFYHWSDANWNNSIHFSFFNTSFLLFNNWLSFFLKLKGNFFYKTRHSQ